MNTQEFLSLVLPSTGLYLAQEVRSYRDRDGNDKLARGHYAFVNHSEMATAIVNRSQATTNPIYYALGGYHNIDTAALQRSPGMKGTRTQANVHSLRSFWLDIDVRDDGKSYPTHGSAAAAARDRACGRSPRGRRSGWPLAGAGRRAPSPRSRRGSGSGARAPRRAGRSASRGGRSRVRRRCSPSGRSPSRGRSRSRRNPRRRRRGRTRRGRDHGQTNASTSTSTSGTSGSSESAGGAGHIGASNEKVPAIVRGGPEIFDLPVICPRGADPVGGPKQDAPPIPGSTARPIRKVRCARAVARPRSPTRRVRGAAA